MKNPTWSRREFLEFSTATASLSLAQPFKFRTVAPSDTVRFGIVGVGMQGSGLLGTSIQLPGVTCGGAADLYDGRHTLAKEIAGAQLPTTREYRRLLDDKNVDCIVAAVPDHWHRKIVVDAVSAGKDIYIEKPMSHSPADGVAMVDAAKKSNRIVQVGSQRVSSQICAKVKELIAQGAIGELMMVEARLGRNDPTGAWQYQPPPDLSTRTLDWDTWQGDVPKRAFDANTFARWRCYKEYGTGVAGDLLVHLISGMMFMLGINEPPKQATSVGGIRRWKDGRNLPDVHLVQYYYGDLPVSMRLNLGTEIQEAYWFHGSKGVLELTGSRISVAPQTGRDSWPSYYVTNSYPSALRKAYEEQWHKDNDPKLGQPLTLAENRTFVAPDFDDTRVHLWTFFEAVRSRKPVVEDVVFGHNAALACHMANEAWARRSAVTWDEATRTVRG